jgi:hypothetical protein
MTLAFASLNGTTVIQDVIGAGWAPLPAPYTGSYYFKCLEYLPNPLVNSQWSAGGRCRASTHRRGPAFSRPRRRR